MSAKPALFATEADLCAAFTTWVQKSAGQFNHGVLTPKWTPYAETAGWDILLVASDGTQIGVQAKLKFNLKVLQQAVPEAWDAWHDSGPDYRAVLVPDRDSGNANLCAALGLMLFAPSGHSSFWPDRGIDFTPGLNMEHWNGGWHYWSPLKRHELPEFVPDVIAGDSAPVQLTKWKIAALRIVARLELRGHVTRQDFRELGIDIRRWVGPQGWLTAGTAPGQFVDANALKLAQQHPGVYPQVIAEERAKFDQQQQRLVA